MRRYINPDQTAKLGPQTIAQSLGLSSPHRRNSCSLLAELTSASFRRHRFLLANSGNVSAHACFLFAIIASTNISAPSAIPAAVPSRICDLHA